MSSAVSNAIDPNEVTLVVNGLSYYGWENVRITKGIEIMPSSFELSLTDNSPNDFGDILAQPGDEIVLKLGNDIAITGFIDIVNISISSNEHVIKITGRGRCLFLVDASAGFFSSTSAKLQFNASTMKDIVSQLASPYGITVVDATAATVYGPESPIPRFLINIGETCFEVIERMAHYKQVLAYEGNDGNLVLSQAGLKEMASGFSLPGNIEAGTINLSMNERYSDYFAFWTSTDLFAQERGQINGSFGALTTSVKDASVPFFKPLAIVSEQTADSADFAQRRCVWEKNRRNGLSQKVEIVCDSWRDSAGKLWEPNSLVPIDAPALRLNKKKWIIAQVTFSKGDGGTTASVSIMPAGAFSPQPTALQGYDVQVSRDLPAAPSTPTK